MGLGPLSEIMSEEDLQQSDKLEKAGNADEDLGSFETTGWSQAKTVDKLAGNSLSKFHSNRKFRHLKLLQLQKISIDDIEGIQGVRGQLECIICTGRRTFVCLHRSTS